MNETAEKFDTLTIEVQLPTVILDDKIYDTVSADFVRQAALNALKQRRREKNRAVVEASDV